jgi:hypothetical protein
MIVNLFLFLGRSFAVVGRYFASQEDVFFYCDERPISSGRPETGSASERLRLGISGALRSGSDEREVMVRTTVV